VGTQLQTVEEVLAALAISRRTLYRLVRAGEIPALKIGRATRFRREDVEVYICRRLEVGLRDSGKAVTDLAISRSGG